MNGAAIIKVLKSPWFWVVISLVVLVLLVRSNASWLSALIKRTFAKDNGNYGQGFQTGANVDEAARKEQLNALAETLYAKINGLAWESPYEVWFDSRDAVLQELLKLNDTELRYTAQQYKFRSRDESMFTAIDNEWMPLTDLDERVLARLANIAMI